MARVLANKNVRLTYHATLVTDTAVKYTGVDTATVTVVAANAGVPIQTLVSTQDYALGATGEDTINDPSLANIGTAESTPGATTYSGQLRWYTEDTATTYDTYKKGVGGFLLERIGPGADTAYVNAQRAHLYQIIFGAQRKQYPSGGGYFTWQQNVGVEGAWEHTTISTALP